VLFQTRFTRQQGKQILYTNWQNKNQELVRAKRDQVDPPDRFRFAAKTRL